MLSEAKAVREEFITFFWSFWDPANEYLKNNALPLFTEAEALIRKYARLDSVNIPTAPGDASKSSAISPSKPLNHKVTF